MGHSHNVPARRNFLKLSARLAALGLTSLGVQPARQFFVRDVEAQSRVTDYKALVCVYMFGGNDANNMIVPADNYTAYSDGARRHGRRGAGRQHAAAGPGAGRRHVRAPPVVARAGADLQRRLPCVRAQHRARSTGR